MRYLSGILSRYGILQLTFLCVDFNVKGRAQQERDEGPRGDDFFFNHLDKMWWSQGSEAAAKSSFLVHLKEEP